MSKNPIEDPQKYLEMYQDMESDYGSERQLDMRRDLSMMAAQYEYDESWYNAHESVQAKIDEMVAAGINPIHAARAAMGSLSQDSGSAPSVSGNGYNRLDSIVGGVNAMSNILGSVNGSRMTDLAMEKQATEVNLMQSEAALNYANAGEVAGLSASTQAKNYAGASRDTAAATESEAHAKLLGEQFNLTKEETRLAMQQADAFADVNKAELENLRAKTAEYWSTVQVNKAQETKLEHETDFVDAEKVLTEAKTDTEMANRDKVVSETAGQRLKNTAQQQVNDFQALIGRPLNADYKDALVGLVNKGDYEGASNLTKAVFMEAEQRALGEAQGGATYKFFGAANLPARSRPIQGFYAPANKNPQ